MGCVPSIYDNDDDSSRIPPRYHFKCRYSTGDIYSSETPLYTRTKDVFRFPVPEVLIQWKVPYRNYTPIRYTAEKVYNYEGVKGHRDPDFIKNPDEYSMITFNKFDKLFNYDRRSYYGNYKFIEFDYDDKVLVPCNPVGRTGIIGRGHLCRWGPNHAADPIVTRWKTTSDGYCVYDKSTSKPILQFVGIQRKDTGKWAIPGGMRESGEDYKTTLIREFSEEALSIELAVSATNEIITSNKFQEKLKDFFSSGIIIYKGYVDDPRNTDNAWMETIVCNFHDETSEIVSTFRLQGGDDAKSAKWVDLSSSLELYASHYDFLRSVAYMHGAYW